MENPVVKINHLTKSFKSKSGVFRAVNDISFSIGKGEIVGLLGPNGAGKTTTIYMLLGLLTPTSGSIEYFGKNLQIHREEIMHQVNFSSSYLSFPWKMSVYDNLDILARLYGVKDRDKRIDLLLKRFEITSLANKRYGDLSAGQKTRVFLAKAFINFPKVLLLDEPTASLDPDIAVKVRQLLMKEREAYGTSMLFTSHNMAEVEEVCDRVIFIDKGKILSEDTPAALAKRIKSVRVKFRIESNQGIISEICKSQSWKKIDEQPYTIIEVKESEIPHLLNMLSEKHVRYSEISIDVPTLEDYFLEVTKK